MIVMDLLGPDIFSTLRIVNERTCFASCACAFKSFGLITCLECTSYLCSVRTYSLSSSLICIYFVLQRVELNLPPLQEKARLKDDMKAIKTIGITIATYFLCYVPAIVHAVVGLQKEKPALHSSPGTLFTSQAL